MPPSLEVMNSRHHEHHDDGVDCFDDDIHKASVEEDLDATETESSDNGDQPTEARIVNGEDWNHIVKPGTHDVLLGRGGGTNNHSGNIKFRKLVNEHKMRYLACSKVEKPKVARQVVALWRKLEPTGRFLTRKDDSKRGPGSVKSSDNVWFEVGDKKAREKASQCLRERTPDVIPYIKHLREQQNAITEQGVSMVQMQMQQQESQQQQLLNSPHHAHAHMMVSMSPQMHHPQQSYSNSVFDPSHQSSPYGAMSPHAAFPRRNSIATHSARRGSLPVAPHLSATNFSTHNPPRRTSLPGGSMMMAPPPQELGFDDQGEYSAEMSEMEYQQQMMMMQQQMMQQQMQMQRMQQSRAIQAQSHHHLRPTSLDASMNGVTMRGHQPSAYGVNDPSAVYEHDPLMTGSNGQVETTKEIPKNKRGRGSDDDAETKTAPDRTTSLMSLTPANPDDNELSLEDYRQQLEEYIANSNKEGDDGNESDLEDDWEKERERAVKQSQALKKEASRGINRNVSGMSCLSTKSSGMSLISGFSGFSEMNMSKEASKTEREKKMSMARSVGSNHSLMSELTDLSQNIDNLSIYDD